ncbi:hypothetical protein ACFLSJ_08675, partial [Verrucomicrobiota bacterium]
PNAFDEGGGRSGLDSGPYSDSLGVGVGAQLGAIPCMLKVHDKYPLEETRRFTQSALLAAVESFDRQS